jgi:hypothetical protein
METCVYDTPHGGRCPEPAVYRIETWDGDVVTRSEGVCYLHLAPEIRYVSQVDPWPPVRVTPLHFRQGEWNPA